MISMQKKDSGKMERAKRDYPWLRELRSAEITVGHESKTFETVCLPRMTRKNIEEKCKKAVDEGCNSIHPSVAHFRWDFLSYLDRIYRFISDTVEIGHKHNLRVWEHHSAVLMRNLPQGLKYKKWQLAKLSKIDFRDGRPFYANTFHSYVLCCANPYFREAYFELVKGFAVKPQIDLFMPDDMGLASSFYDCACPYCRRLFKKLSGYRAPGVGEPDMNFFMNIANPAWRAWVRFRSTKVALFLKELRAFLDSQGRSELAMTCCNSDSLSNLSRMFSNDHEAEILEGELDLAFHEMCEPQAYFWPRSVVERQTNIGISEYAGVPLIAHPYTVSNEETVFVRLQHLTHGQGFNATGANDAYVKNANYSLNKFAGRHQELFQARPASNVAAVFSRNTRDFYGKDVFTRTYLELHTDELAGWCESTMRMNYPFRVIPESQVEAGNLEGIDLLILPNCACMSVKEAAAIRKFVKNGGSLIATNETSLYDQTGSKGKDFLLGDIFGLAYLETDRAYSYSIIKNTAKADTVMHYTFSNFPQARYDAELRDAIFAGIPRVRLVHHGQQAIVRVKGRNTQVLAHTPVMQGFSFGHAALTMNEYGQGRVMYFSGLPGLMCHMITNYQYSQYGEDPFEYIPPLEPAYGRFMQNIIGWALGEKRLFTFNKVVGGMYVNYNILPNRLKKFIHLNATPKLQFEKDGIHYKGLKQLWQNGLKGWPKQEYMYKNPHKYPSSWNPGLDYVRIPELELTIGEGIKFSKARMAGIEFPGWKNLRVKNKDGFKGVKIPSKVVGRYAFIELS